jgi:hypothetical protein
MTDNRTWRLFQIDGVLNESEPVSQDVGEWAHWYERKATAAELLRDEALASGDADGAEVAADLAAKAKYAIRRLRDGGRS